MTADEPGISVRSAATRPPVQDSAVAIVRPAARQRSRRAAARAARSVGNMEPCGGVADYLGDFPGRQKRFKSIAGQRRTGFLTNGLTSGEDGPRLSEAETACFVIADIR